MATYILVHGACHGGWCWYKIVSRLQKMGHKVFAPDLPGHGIDHTPLKNVTLKAYVDCICNLIDQQTEPVILVGHSAGGIVISQVAEYRPQKIKHLIYLAARLVANNESMLDNAANKTLSKPVHSLFRESMIFSEDKSSFSLKESNIRDALYNRCADEDVALAKLLLVPQALEPVSSPITISDQNYGRVPRSYIRTLRDMSIPVALQDHMLTIMPCQQIMTLDSDHSPFFSMPDELVDCFVSDCSFESKNAK